MLLLCLSLILSLSVIPAFAEGEAERDKATVIKDAILSYKLNEAGKETVGEWIDGLSTEIGSTAEWYIFSLAHEDYDFDKYEEALLTYLANNSVHSAVTRQKYALALSAIGSTNSFIHSTLSDSVGKMGIMSYVYGLHLLNNGYTGTGYTKDSVINELLSRQCEDGGWSVMDGVGDVDVSAMVIEALAPSKDEDKVNAAIGKALDFLKACQLDSGDFQSYGITNSESTSQVIIALSALGIDCESDTEFIRGGNTLFDVLDKYRLGDGSFSHTEGGVSNENATVQALMASVAYSRMKGGEGSVYLYDLADPENLEEYKPSDKENTTDDTPENDGISYKLWVALAIVLLGGIASLVLFLMKKRSYKNFLFVLLIVAIAITLLFLLEFKSADDYYNGEGVTKDNPIGSVTISIRCDTVAGRAEHIPEDGIILDKADFLIEEGDTVYDILIEAARKYSIQIENDGGGISYISGINNIYEFDFGDLSGWVYHVNGSSASVGCAEYVLHDGDSIVWHYSTSLGNDIN